MVWSFMADSEEGLNTSCRSIRTTGERQKKIRPVEARFLPLSPQTLPTEKKVSANYSVSSKRCSRKRCRQQQECVRNASEIGQKCVKNVPKWVLLCWEKRNVPNCIKNESKCVKNARNTFGGEHLLDDAELFRAPWYQTISEVNSKRTNR